jgi:O-antigen/teichoic acid export membrane protein
VQVWSALFVFHVSIRTRAMIIDNQQFLASLYAFLTMLLNVILNYILILRFGVIGAVYAFFISWSISVLLLPFLSKQTRFYAHAFLKSFSIYNFFKKINMA